MNFDQIIRYLGWSNVKGDIIKPGERIAKDTQHGGKNWFEVQVGHFQALYGCLDMFWCLFKCVISRDICP